MNAFDNNPRVQRLLDELVELTGTSTTEVVLVALQERLARLKGPVSRDERIDKVLAELRSTSSLDGDLSVPSPREWNRALGYGQEGV